MFHESANNIFPSPEMYTQLKFLVSNENQDMDLAESAKSIVEEVYTIFANKDPEFVEALSKLIESGVLAPQDRLCIFVLVHTARTVGPYDALRLREYIMGDATAMSPLEQIEYWQLDQELQKYLKEIVEKVVKDRVS